MLAGTLHFTHEPFYLRMMPPHLPAHEELIRASGVADAGIPGGAPALWARLPFQGVFIWMVRAAMRAG